MTSDAQLALLSPDGAALARSLLARLRAFGTVSEREGRQEIALFALAAGVELARLQLRPEGLPRLVFAAEAAREPMEIIGLASAAAAAEAVRALAERATAAAPQLDLFGKR